MDNSTRAPAAQSVSLGGQEYVIPTNILCGKAINAVREQIKIQRTNSVMGYLQMAISTQGGAYFMAFAKDIETSPISWNDIDDAISNPDMLAYMWSAVSTETYDKLLQVCREYPVYQHLVDIVKSYDNLGNSPLPAEKETTKQEAK